MSNFFTNEIISEFSTQINPVLTKLNCSLLNVNAISEYLAFSELDARGLRRSAHPRRTQKAMQEIGPNIDHIVNLLAQQKCASIGEDYGKDAIRNPLKHRAKAYDLLVLIDNQYQTVEYGHEEKGKRKEDFLKYTYGFIVAEKGECKRKPKTVSVNLICSNGVQGGGTILIGAYLYTIKCFEGQTNYDQYGILELAHGFENFGGLCTYSKFGFVANMDLFKVDPIPKGTCFTDDRNLPMDVNLETVSKTDIVEVVLGRKKISFVDPHLFQESVHADEQDYLRAQPLCIVKPSSSDERTAREFEKKKTTHGNNLNTLVTTFFDKVRTEEEIEIEKGKPVKNTKDGRKKERKIKSLEKQQELIDGTLASNVEAIINSERSLKTPLSPSQGRTKKGSRSPGAPSGRMSTRATTRRSQNAGSRNKRIIRSLKQRK